MYSQLAGRGVEEEVLDAFTQLFSVAGTDPEPGPRAGSGSSGGLGDILGREKGSTGGGKEGGFDWASTYMMRLEALPESHVSAGEYMLM